MRIERTLDFLHVSLVRASSRQEQVLIREVQLNMMVCGHFSTAGEDLEPSGEDLEPSADGELVQEERGELDCIYYQAC